MQGVHARLARLAVREVLEDVGGQLEHRVRGSLLV